MQNLTWTAYRAALRLLPQGVREFAREARAGARLDDAAAGRLRAVFRRRHVVGATLALFDARGVTDVCWYGLARRGVPARADTVYRAASVSKLVSALGVMRLAEQGKLDLDADVSALLGYRLRHPRYPEQPITLAMLLAHTSGLRDGPSYFRALYADVPLRKLIGPDRESDDNFRASAPGAAFEYCNLGAGMAGTMVEAATGLSFENYMQREVFAPLGVTATFYPQKAGEGLADAYRVLPPSRRPPFDAAARAARPLPEQVPNPDVRYMLAHGNLCVSAPELARIGVALATGGGGVASPAALARMRKPAVPFGAWAQGVSQGLGVCIVERPRGGRLYGHQGMAYGAVHGLFFDPAAGRGYALLTAGASEARGGMLADLNLDVLALVFGGDV